MKPKKKNNDGLRNKPQLTSEKELEASLKYEIAKEIKQNTGPK